MSRRLILRSWVKTDLADAEQWYRKQRSGLEKDFRAEVKARLAEVRLRPMAFAVKYKTDIRTALVERFPFQICFVVNADAIVVLGILHARRNIPRHLNRRK